MYKKVSVKKLGRKKSHREALVQNQLRTLFENGKLNTTIQKAKVTKAKAESVISSIKSDDGKLELRRSLQVTFGNSDLVKKVYEYAKKEEASVKIVRTGFRAGDNALKVRLDLAGFSGKAKKTAKKEETVEEKKVEKKEAKKEGIENLGKKSVTKQTGTATKARARSRSGL